MEIYPAEVNGTSTSDHGADDTGSEAQLSIGELAERTGVTAATLRVWESRHGFPVPHRRDSGHRRYDEHHVAAVLDVVRRRAEGVRLDVAIEQAVAARSAAAAPTPSVFARLRDAQPHLGPHRLRKSTLTALSWAIEDEFCSRPQQACVFGAFQQPRHFVAAEARWRDLARVSRATYVFADFSDAPDGSGPDGDPHRVGLPPDHPMLSEWVVVCDGPDLPVALAAWELPGQDTLPDAVRIFEAVWTVEPTAVREAARVCARTAAEAGAPGSTEVAGVLAGPAGPGRADLAQVTALFNRVVSYVDRVTLA